MGHTFLLVVVAAATLCLCLFVPGWSKRSYALFTYFPLCSIPPLLLYSGLQIDVALFFFFFFKLLPTTVIWHRCYSVYLCVFPQSPIYLFQPPFRWKLKITKQNVRHTECILLLADLAVLPSVTLLNLHKTLTWQQTGEQSDTHNPPQVITNKLFFEKNKGHTVIGDKCMSSVSMDMWG